MAPQSYSESPASIMSNLTHTFFQRVDSKSFPAVQQKEQPWMKFLDATTNTKKPMEDERMTVLCGLRHDYGKEPDPDIGRLHLTHGRELRPRWLLTKRHQTCDTGSRQQILTPKAAHYLVL